MTEKKNRAQVWFDRKRSTTVFIVGVRMFFFVFLKILARTFFRICQTIGVVPFGFNFITGKANVSMFWRCYTAVILIIITICTHESTSTINSHMHFLRQQRLMHFVGSNRCVVLHVCAIFNILIQLVKNRCLIYCCNQGVRIFVSLRALSIGGDITAAFDRSFLFQVLAKLATLWPMTQTTVFYITHDGALDDVGFLFALLSQYLCQLMIYMPLNMFYGGTLVITAYVWHLNRCMKKIFGEIRALRKHPRSWNSFKMQKFCEFADVLDRVIRIYKRLAVLTRLVNQQYQVQIFCSMVYLPIECIAQLYFTYFVYTHNNNKPVVMNWGAIFYITSLLLDLFVCINACEGLTRAFGETKWIVRMGTDVARVDVRLEKLLEQFSVYLDCERVHYSACGLLTMNNRCLVMMGQCLLTSLLILIQFDKILK